MDPSTGNDFSGGNTTGQGSAPGGAAPTSGAPVNGGTTSGGMPIGGMPVNSSAPTGGMPVNNAMPTNRTSVDGGASVSGGTSASEMSVNGGASVINRIPTSNVMSMNGSTANSGMPVDVGRAQSNEGDIVLNPSSNRRKKSKLFVAIAIIMVLIIVGVGVAVYFINDNNLKSNIKARWANYYNMLVYGSIEKPEDSRDSIYNDSSKWFLRNLDSSLEKKGYDSYEKYFSDVKDAYMVFYNLAKDRAIVKDGVYNSQVQSFLNYNLRDDIVDDLERMYLEKGLDETEKHIDIMFGDNTDMLDVYLKSYFENYVGLMKEYDSNGCYDELSSEESRICKITLNNEKVCDYYDAINYVNDSLSHYYDNVFLIGFCTQMMELNQKIGVVL